MSLFDGIGRGECIRIYFGGFHCEFQLLEDPKGRSSVRAVDLGSRVGVDLDSSDSKLRWEGIAKPDWLPGLKF